MTEAFPEGPGPPGSRLCFCITPTAIGVPSKHHLHIPRLNFSLISNEGNSDL